MTAIFVCTHGNSASEMIKSAEMICGNQINVGSTHFEVGETPEDLQTRIVSELSNLDLSEGIMFLVDLKGGTPFNVIIQLTKKYPDNEVLTGVNIPMLLEAFINKENLNLNELAEKSFQSSINGIYRYEVEEVEDDEDF
ncbi:PTS sugar transporter subunit IIA [Lactobacillus sp. YT155]|uniref:PTS sugar transporter subunit IIA n=1 Tax=Lactobacillus sp. YT155 TaxID=3060955 RepID=UPI00265F5432|nr:PTS sugar transporter subunit IIA [Lactobacillus sp. YT155]MDO1604671.1 PTS sugar transporter subunit IIA [Lactobacillus sp. YT155]